MRSAEAIAQVMALRAEGLGARRIAARTNLPVSTVRDWLAGRLPSGWSANAGAAMHTCERCGHERHAFGELPPQYLYLLGVYLGDGCISEHPRKVFRLRLFLDLEYPAIIDECETAIRLLAPRSKVYRLERRGNYTERAEATNVELSAFSRIWPCLIPQHGPGKKHTRSVALTEWQLELVERDPRQLLRGLVHSDGCRFINTGRNWVCPRYAFTNMSADIRQIFCDACDLLDLRYTFAGERNVYVSRKADVAFLDTFIGPKR